MWEKPKTQRHQTNKQINEGNRNIKQGTIHALAQDMFSFDHNACASISETKLHSSNISLI